MVSVRIDAESPEEIATLLRSIVAGGKSDIIRTVREYEKALHDCLSDAADLRRHSEAGRAALKSKADEDYRAAREKLDEIRASEATRGSDAERQHTSA